MTSQRTRVTEIATGLGLSGVESLDEAFQQRPDALVGVDTAVWDSLEDDYRSGTRPIDFEGAWRNGRALLEAQWGLRGRVPLRIEWKGPHRVPAYEFLPADLRVDYVFLVSCKHDSYILANTSPRHLFEDLQWGRIEADRGDWYQDVAPLAYQDFYDLVRKEVDTVRDLPDLVTALSRDDRLVLKRMFSRTWTPSLQDAYETFAFAVACESARRWTEATATRQRRELAFWRLMRIGGAPYFLLGAADGQPIRLRIVTPWDWRREFDLVAFGVTPRRAAQPRVDWEARVRDRATGTESSIAGFVEIRWSHGRFSGAPEAKVQLLTPHHDVPGYFPLI